MSNIRPHLSLNVRNVALSVEFYRKVFRADPQKQTEGYAKFDLKDPALNFSMLAATDGRIPSRVNHLGIEVDSMEDVKIWQRRLAANGIETLSEEQTDCCYALQDKVWFRDPDGNSWEVFFVHAQLPTEAAEPPKVKKSCGPGTGCC